ncbi:flagellar basal body P-ring formation chaperone FlgA [Acetobacter estunensis]|uniref:flagellar basal body P-ring formation chaperone FlgA n=1 Tax=Acetobacter estunensis TaxID=104097 RepID=UPI001C2D3404|nr:flagellar basal body P-ring formation chaperone FlgA [Acetobacter estunensis]MBV1836611.1 flagellar basal body P-ring formation chaperone FlgA [Acetobacter estunensis]
MILTAHRLFLILGMGVCLASSPLNAATLRRTATLHNTQVHLSDLFEGLDPGQDCDLGPAPAVGQTLVIGGPQLEAIAQQFGVDWPDASELAQTTLTRASHTITEDEVMPFVLSGLKDRGVSDTATIDLADFIGPTVAADPAPTLRLTNIVYDATHGHFSAFFSIPQQGSAPVSFRADGTVSSRMDVVVASHDLVAGQVLAASDLTTATIDSRALPSGAILDPDDAVDMLTKHDIRAHTTLTTALLDHVLLVEKGAPVVLDVSSTGLHLTASGVALDSGARGEHIHVLNPVSRMVVVGSVIDRTRVEVTPGTTPMPADAHELHSNGQRSHRNI